MMGVAMAKKDAKGRAPKTWTVRGHQLGGELAKPIVNANTRVYYGTKYSTNMERLGCSRVYSIFYQVFFIELVSWVMNYFLLHDFIY